MSTVKIICDRIGRRPMAQALGVRPTAISNAVSEGMFPARWFVVVRRMCGERGIDCPEALFNFQDGASVAAVEGQPLPDGGVA